MDRYNSRMEKKDQKMNHNGRNNKEHTSNRLKQRENVPIFDDERIDYLVADETMKIIQSPSVFCFSLDAVLLAHFTYVPIKKGKILDLCAGNGAISILLTKRSNAQIVGLEIQERLVSMAYRSIKLNNLQEQVSIIHGDLKDVKLDLKQSSFDLITCNPPYFNTPKESEYNKNEHETIAKHEVFCTLEDVVKACKRYVKPGGKIAIVHRPGRLVDLITLFRKYRLEPKRIQFVYPKEGEEANIVLIEGIRDGNVGLKMLPPLYIYNKNDTYTVEAEAIIYGN